jgi:2-polyprenyl-3-methyl-5-hydroxy-6-metoxy-1,4-benzoquinol methylase
VTSLNGRFVTRTTCELCGAARSRTLLARQMTDPAVWEFLEAYYEGRIPKTALDGAEYRVMFCEECGFVWQGEVLAADAMRVLYREWISAEASLNKKRFGAAALFSDYASQARRIAELIGKPPHETDVLDFGMGWGYWCRMAQAFGYRVTGLEVADDRRAHAQSMGIRAIDTLPGGDGGHFDFINAEQVFEHITDPIGTARQLGRTLRPRGALRIAVPDAAPAIRDLAHPGWKARKDALHPLEHINGFTHETLVRLGKAAGLHAEEPAADTRGLRRFLPALVGRLSRPPLSGTCLLFRKAG